MTIVVVGTRHVLVPIRLDVVLAVPVMIHGDGSMTRSIPHMIAKL
jgi:hypothetical protein